MANPRTKARIEARIHERVAYCLEFELNDPRGSFLTVTKVELSSDLTVAKVWYSVLGGQSERARVARMLEDATGFVRKQIGRVLRMRRIPRLAWVYDDSIEYAADVERKIGEALRHDREINPAAHPELSTLPPGEAEAEEIEDEYEDFLDAQEEGEDLR